MRAAFERETTPTIGDALEALALGTPGAEASGGRFGGRVWSRRSGHRDAFAVTIGWGERVLDLGVSAESLPPECELALTRAAHHDHVPVAVDLGPGAAIAVAGEHADAVARSLVVQLATWCGPADWRLVVIVDEPAAWAWAEWLPHACVGEALWVLAADGAGELDDALTAPRRHVDRPPRGGDGSPRPDGQPQQPAPTLPRRGHVGGHDHRRRWRRGRAGGLRQRAGRRVAVHRAMVPRRR